MIKFIAIATNTRMTVLIRRLKPNEEFCKKFLNTETIKYPTIRLTRKTSTSRNKIILELLISGSAYFDGTEPIPNLIRNKMKSMIVQDKAMIKIVLISFLFTTEPRGSMSLEVFISFLVKCYTKLYAAFNNSNRSLTPR